MVGASGVLLASCAGDDAALDRDRGDTTTSTTVAAPTSGEASPPTTLAGSPTRALLDAVCTGAPEIVDVGALDDGELTELSGLVSGRRDPSRWWAHNDSGDTARLFQLEAAGDGTVARVATVELVDDRGDPIDARDWEDLAIGPPDTGDGAATLYVGDIGDNAGVHPSIRVHRLAEPDPADGETVRATPETLTLTYPDGAHDAEALLVDPLDGDLLVVTKDWSLGGASEVYRAPAGLDGGSTTELEHVASLPLPVGTLVTAADVSPDGSVVAVRSYGAVALYERPAGEPLWAAFATTPCDGPAPRERQGESLGFAADGASYVTVSEGDGSVLHRTTP